MGRLTQRNSMGVAVYKQPYECDKCNETIWRFPDYGNGSPTDRLAKYEELEEQCIKETTWGFKELLHKWKVFLEDMVDLVKYRQLEEQGLLLKLPCKVGDGLYVIEDKCVLKYSVNGYTIREDSFLINVMEYPCSFNLQKLGKTMFLTYEEAEQALKQMGE